MQYLCVWNSGSKTALRVDLGLKMFFQICSRCHCNSSYVHPSRKKPLSTGACPQIRKAAERLGLSGHHFSSGTEGTEGAGHSACVLSALTGMESHRSSNLLLASLEFGRCRGLKCAYSCLHRRQHPPATPPFLSD